MMACSLPGNGLRKILVIIHNGLSNIEMLKTKCPICGSLEDYTIIHKSNFACSDINLDVFSARRLPDLVHYQIVKCNNDGLARSNPIYKDVIHEDLYKHSKFNYSDQTDNLTVTYLEVLDGIISYLSKETKILEIGCGNGFVLKALLDRGYKNLCGIEPSQDAVLKADGIIKDRIMVDVLREGLYKSESFDLIFLFQVFDHIQDPLGFLSICYNLLSPGGSILVMAHDIKSLSARVLGEKSPIIDIEHMYFYSKKTIKEVFVKAGFNPLKIYSPRNMVSFKYLIWLLPIPKKIKLKLLNSKGRFADFLLNQRVRIRLGNLCIIARKADGSSK